MASMAAAPEARYMGDPSVTYAATASTTTTAGADPKPRVWAKPAWR